MLNTIIFICMAGLLFASTVFIQVGSDSTFSKLGAFVIMLICTVVLTIQIIHFK